MINKNYRNGVVDVGKMAAKGFSMVGKEIIGGVGELKKAIELQNIFENKILDHIDDADIRLKLIEYGFSPVDFSLIDNMPAENKITLISALYLLTDADETKQTSEYFGVSVLRFGVRQLIDGDNARIEELVEKFSANEAVLLMRMICEMCILSNNNGAVVAAGEAIIDNLQISGKRKKEIKTNLGKLANACGASIFTALLAAECKPIADEPENEATDSDGYDICNRFSAFDKSKVKFIDTDVVFTDRYSVSDSSIIFENCTLVFESNFPHIVDVAGGDFTFINCKFTSKQKQDGVAFILRGADVTLYNCTFEKWKSGLFLSLEKGSLSLMECSFLSCESKLISTEQLTGITFDKCRIKRHKGEIALLSLENNTSIDINDCDFTDCNYSSGFLFASYSESITVNRATISNCGMNIVSGMDIEYRNCKFDGCHDDMAINFTKYITFSYCDITNHNGNIGTAFATSSHIIIKACMFKDFTGSFFAKSFDISNSSFENLRGDSSGSGINTENYLYLDDLVSVNVFNGMVSTGSLFEIKPNKESAFSQIANCKFIRCKCNGALVVAFSEDKSKSVVNISNCELTDCQCAEGYFVGVFVKNDKFYQAPRIIEAWENTVDLYDDEHKRKLLSFLKRALTNGLVKGCTKFHKTPVDYKIEKNIRECVMDGSYDDVLTMYDDSIFANGKSGLVFGRKAIYFTQLMESNYYIPYEKIAMINALYIDHKKFGDNYNATLTIELGNYRSIVFSNPNIEKKELQKVLLGIKDVFS